MVPRKSGRNLCAALSLTARGPSLSCRISSEWLNHTTGRWNKDADGGRDEERNARISMMGFSLPVVFKLTRCCFSIIRMGLMQGAERMEATVASSMPTSFPSPRRKEDARRMPNLGTRLNRTPTSRGPRPERQAPIGLFLNTLLACCEQSCARS